jgi:flagellar biosynthesis protein FlhF
MLLKRFQAKSSSEALTRVKEELGPHAAILETRRTRGGGVEVVAAAERPQAQREAVGHGKPGGQMSAESKAARTSRPPSAYGSALDEGLPCAPSIAWLRRDLLSRGFSPYLAERLTAAAGANLDEEVHASRQRVFEYLRDLISLWIPGSPKGDAGSRMCILVGPPGVGKTTTIAKLAARDRVRNGRHVVLASADDRRLGGAEQLQAFARLLQAPFMVLRSKADLTRALDRAGIDGMLYVDTPGVRRGDVEGLERLTQLLGGVRRDEIELLLAADRDARGLNETVERFRSLAPGAIGATRTDESVSQGALVSALARAHLPVRHVTMGPDIPDDIEDADARRLAAWALPRTETAS